LIGSDRLMPVSDTASAAKLKTNGEQASLHYIAYPQRTRRNGKVQFVGRPCSAYNSFATI
jgi:hypothetical protein